MPAIDPIVLFFLLGLAAGVARADLRLPGAIYDFLSMLLLLAIGLKGGVELAKQSLITLLPQMGAVLCLGILLPLVAYPLLRWRLTRVDAAAIAAHYGSVSVGTFAVAVAFLASQHIDYEAHMPVFLVLLEMPAIIIGILLARGLSAQTNWKHLGHEIFLGKSMVLLGGGLLIGWFAGPQGIAPVGALFFDLFKGFLALFLLEMGLIAASQMAGLRRHGLFLIAFGIAMPLLSALVGAALGGALSLSLGGTTLLACLAASASYIAVPAAMRMALPEANPTLSLAASLGVTFPFNILIGIPMYLELSRFILRTGS